MSAITALTAQNTTGVSDIYEVTADFLKAQLKAIFEDITPDAIKIGMVSSKDLIIAIAESLKKYNGKNIVLDPVMVATSGAKLISDEAIALESVHPVPCVFGLLIRFPLNHLYSPSLYNRSLASLML